MRTGRFFVTAVILMIIALGTVYFSGSDAASSLIQKGNSELREAEALEADLAKYSVHLAGLQAAGGKALNPQAMAQAYYWPHLTRQERWQVKQKLAEYLALVQSVLEIDARRGLYLTNKEVVFGKRDAAQDFQKSLEAFEKKIGENFDPKPEDLPGPVFYRPSRV